MRIRGPFLRICVYVIQRSSRLIREPRRFIITVNQIQLNLRGITEFRHIVSGGRSLPPTAKNCIYKSHLYLLLELISKKRLSAHGCVAVRLKMLTYYRVCSAFEPNRALP